MAATNLSFKEIIDVNQLKELFEAFSKATNLTTALLDNESNEIIIQTGWRSICADFHRNTSQSLHHCNLRKRDITDKLRTPGEVEIKRCLNGLIDGFTPIIVNGQHRATLTTGQVLFTEPDPDEFIERAKLYNYDEKAYLEALAKVPIIKEETFKAMLSFIAHISTIIAKTGFAEIEKGLKSDEEALQKSLLKSLINSIPDLVFYKDMDNRYLGCNSALENFLKLKEDKIIGLTDFDIFPEEVAKAHHKSNAAVIKTGITNHDIQWITYPNGSEAFQDTLCSPYIGPDGEIVGLIGVSRDVTRLKETEEKLKVILDTVPDGILVIDAKTHKFLTANKTACKMFGYTLEEFHNIQIKDLHPEYQQTKFLKAFEEHIKQEKSVSRDWPIQTKDGDIFWADISTGIGTLGESKFLIGIVRDITDQKEAAKKLLLAKKLESVGMLAGGIAHDYNNILTAILGNIGLASTYLPPDSKAYGFIKDAEAASIRAKALTTQLLTFAKGGAPIKEASSIEQIILESADFALSGSQINCNFNIPEDLWHVDLDSLQMSEVIKNIVLNAKSAMPSEGIIKITCENITPTDVLPDEKNDDGELERREHVKIQISDSGTGISSKDIEQIFDPYFTTNHTSSGLGLAVSHSIVSKHGGKISVESKINEGTTFTILLPASPDVSSPVNNKAKESDKKLQIIVMDDEAMVRNVAQNMLEHLGHSVTLAKNGTEAIKLHDEYYKEDRKIDLLIMDLTVPDGMGGKDALKEILKTNPKAKAIVASGYSSDPIMSNYQTYGFKASMSKPFEITYLKRIIDKVMNSPES